MATLKEDVNAAYQRMTGNRYSYVSNPELLALIEVLSPSKPEFVPAPPTDDVPAIPGVVFPNPATTEETK